MPATIRPGAIKRPVSPFDRPHPGQWVFPYGYPWNPLDKLVVEVGSGGDMARPFYTGLPVTAGRMPPHRVALLNAIAGGESSGKYDIRYTPKGGTKFSGFDKHPGIKERGPHGPSTAAGRYQFLESTWDDLGGGAFTPERQDEMAWRLADRDYRARTDRDLDADLQAKGLDPEIMEALSPTWRALESNRPRHQTTFQQTLGEILGGDAAVTPAGGDGSDEMETDMAIRTGAPGGFSGGYGAANRLGLALSPSATSPASASPALAAPLFGSPNRSKILAEVLENMKEESKKPNPQSWIETGVRALGQGVQGFFAGHKLREEDAEEQRQRDMIADILEGKNPEAAAAARQGFGGVDSWESAVLKDMFKETEADSFTLSPGQARYSGDQEVASLPAKPEKPSSRQEQVQMLTETGVPEYVAKGVAAGRYVVSRHPTSEVAQVVDKATGKVVFDGYGNAGAGQTGAGGASGEVADPGSIPQGGVGGTTRVAPGAEQEIPSFIPGNVDPAQAHRRAILEPERARRMEPQHIGPAHVIGQRWKGPARKVGGEQVHG